MRSFCFLLHVPEGETRSNWKQTYSADVGIPATTALEILAADGTSYMIRTANLMIQMLLPVVEIQVALFAVIVAVEFVLLEMLKGLEPKGTGLPRTREILAHLQGHLCCPCPLRGITCSQLYWLLSKGWLVHDTGFPFC